jgi:hypothetical protein
VSAPQTVTITPHAAPGQQLVDGASDDPVLIVNLDAQATLVVSSVPSCPVSQSVPLTPGKSIAWPAATPCYAYATGAGTTTTPTALVSPGGAQMLPSAHDIATQLAAGYSIVDYTTDTPAGVPLDATGTATLRFGAVPAGQFWQVTRIVESGQGNVMPTMRVYVVTAGAPLTQQFLRSGTSDGLFDEADYPGDGLWVLAGQELACQWTGGQPNGGTCFASAQLRLAQRA